MKALAARAASGHPGVVGVMGTAVLHGLAAFAIIAANHQPKRAPLPAYSVELIAAPRASAESGESAAEAAEPAATTQPPAPERPAPALPASAAKRAAPSPRASQPAPAPTPPAAAEPSKRAAAAPSPGGAAPAAGAAKAPGPPVTSPNTSAAPGTGTAPATIKTVGVEFPFEGYLRNLVAQVYRRWHPPAGNADLESELLFFVHRDGSITGLQFVRRSGSFGFDLEAQGAVEAASRAGAFGPLPAGFGPDILPVSFFFSPRSLR